MGTASSSSTGRSDGPDRPVSGNVRPGDQRASGRHRTRREHVRRRRGRGLGEPLQGTVVHDRGKGGAAAGGARGPTERRAERPGGLLTRPVGGHPIVGPSVRVASFGGLLVDVARAQDAGMIVKGLRAVSDYEYEIQMAQMNQRIGGVETLFMATSPKWSFLSSSLVKEVARLGGDVEGLVPDQFRKSLVDRLGAS